MKQNNTSLSNFKNSEIMNVLLHNLLHNVLEMFGFENGMVENNVKGRKISKDELY